MAYARLGRISKLLYRVQLIATETQVHAAMSGLAIRLFHHFEMSSLLACLIDGSDRTRPFFFASKLCATYTRLFIVVQHQLFVSKLNQNIP